MSLSVKSQSIIMMKKGIKVTDKKEKLVYKRNDGRWEARYTKSYTPEGRAVYGAVYGESRNEVIKKRKEAVKKIAPEGLKEELKEEPLRLNLLILGAGSHGRNIKEIAEQLRVFNKISFVDDAVVGEDVVGKCKDVITLKDKYACAFVALGDNKKRKRWTKFLKKEKFMIPSIISPAATISPKAVIGEGVAILPQSTVNESIIGDFCILASNSLINFGANVGSFSHIDCGGIVKKEAVVPEGTWVKAGKVYSGNRKNIEA